MVLFSGLYSVSLFNYKDCGFLLGGVVVDVNKFYNKGNNLLFY